jgi:hypothetical protein
MNREVAAADRDRVGGMGSNDYQRKDMGVGHDPVALNQFPAKDLDGPAAEVALSLHRM